MASRRTGLFFACSSPVALCNDLPVAVCGHLCLCKSIGRGFPAMSIVMLAHIHQTFCFASIFMQCACRVAFIHRKCSSCACCQCRVVRIDVAYNPKSHAKACEHCYCVSCMFAVFSSCKCACCVSVIPVFASFKSHNKHLRNFSSDRLQISNLTRLVVAFGEGEEQ